ncbi:MAG: SMI1/KNR4 family protein [Christensenellaceae bacterium]|nr:SMI1/KNR4 family protein [Christensenellaceae bacterium]
MYRELIGRLIEGHHWAKLQEPCSEAEMIKAEKYVGFDFPEELKKLLGETNGDHWFLLSAEEIIEQVKRNREILAVYLEPEEFEEKVNRFVYFATNGCGDYYGYRVLANGKTDASAIYIWEHELFEIREVAKDITDLITKYYNSEI